MPIAMVVIAHPNPGRFNHAIADAAAAGFAAASFEVRRHDLYAEGFQPLLSAGDTDMSRSPTAMLADKTDELLSQHRRDLVAASALAIVHPNWWGKPPAMMAGWIDRVLIPGVAYT